MMNIKEYGSRIFHGLKAIIESDELEWDSKEKDDGWSIKEVVGHLCDSAQNNYQRFIRFYLDDETKLLRYDQEKWVDFGQYRNMNSDVILMLWTGLNEMLLNVIEKVSEKGKGVTVRLGESEYDMSHIVKDYYDHMEIHKQQITRIMGK